MKVLNINSYYYSSTVHRKLMNEVQTQGVDAITYAPVFKGYKPRQECRYKPQDEVIKSECYSNIDKFFFYVKHNKIVKDLESKIDVSGVDCLHAHSLFSNGYVAMKLKEKYKIPYIVCVRGTDIEIFFRKLFYLRKLGVEILNNADKIIFLSSPAKDLVLNKYCNKEDSKKLLSKTSIIPNGIDNFWLNNKAEPKSIVKNEEIKLLYVGALMKLKNIDVTLKALDILHSKGVKVTYKAVGSAKDSKLKNLIMQSEFATYIPQVTKEELIDIYRDSDIFVMPSKIETFGLVYAEAMSQGLPVIYSAGQGFDRQFVDGEVGYAVNSSDEEDIAQRILDVINNYETLSKNCIIKSDKFNWKTIAREYKEIYESV